MRETLGEQTTREETPVGLELIAFNCPYCGQAMSQSIGPSYTVLTDVPTPSGGSVVMLTCINAACNRALGPYVVPNG